jgi:IPT/TIG domain-containing protein
MPRRITATTLTLVALVSFAGVADASPKAGAKSAAARKTPVITMVSPMRVRVGSLITIRGRNFSSNRRRNTVVFVGPGGRSAFAKPVRAGRRKLVVRVPGTVERLLNTRDGARVPTRMRLRVLAGRFSRFTPPRLSPVVVSRFDTSAFGLGGGGAPGGGGGGAPGGGGAAGCGSGSDPDNDLLSTSTESQINTDPCRTDTDGDGIEDGFEFQSAIDLNDDEYEEPNESKPYPGKRPYPNPLDPSDGDTDYDRDVLTQREEQALWRYTVSNGGPRTLSPLSYSDGLQASLYTRGPDGRRYPSQPIAGYGKHQDFLNWASANGYRTVMLENEARWGLPAGSGLRPYSILDFNRSGAEESGFRPNYFWEEPHYYDHDNDDWTTDNERDEDADGLTNYDETHGRLAFPGWWNTCYSIERPFTVVYAGTNFIDPDSDGDGVRDGADDQDHDDVPNLMEISRNMASGEDDQKPGGKLCEPADGLPQPPATHHPDVYGRVNPFNPCLPSTAARTCDRHPVPHAPFDGSPNWYSLN